MLSRPQSSVPFRRKKKTKNYVASTDIGKRDSNQDKKFVDLRRKIFILCDGMGGANGGERISEYAVKILDLELNEVYGLLRKKYIDENDILDFLEQRISYTNEIISATTAKVDVLTKGGTTLDVAMIYKNKIYTGHVGDGTIYLVDNSKKSIERLTEPHVSFLSDISSLSDIEKQIVASHMALKSYIGQGVDIKIDLTVNAFENSTLFMHTDGYNLISKNEILNLIMKKDHTNLKQNLINKRDNPVEIRLAYEELNEKGLGFKIDSKQKKQDNSTFIMYERD